MTTTRYRSQMPTTTVNVLFGVGSIVLAGLLTCAMAWPQVTQTIDSFRQEKPAAATAETPASEPTQTVEKAPPAENMPGDKPVVRDVKPMPTPKPVNDITPVDNAPKPDPTPRQVTNTPSAPATTSASAALAADPDFIAAEKMLSDGEALFTKGINMTNRQQANREFEKALKVLEDAVGKFQALKGKYPKEDGFIDQRMQKVKKLMYGASKTTTLNINKNK